MNALRVILLATLLFGRALANPSPPDSAEQHPVEPASPGEAAHETPPAEPAAHGHAPAAPAVPSGSEANARVEAAAAADSATVARSLLAIAAQKRAQKDVQSAELAYVEVLNLPVADEIRQDALIDYAAFLNETGRAARAASTLEKFLDQYPGAPRTPMVLIELGRTLRDMGAFNLALARFYSVLNSTLAASPEAVDDLRGVTQQAKFEIAETYFQQGDYPAAVKYFGRVKLLDLPEADQARAAFREAYAWYLDGRLDQAAPALQSYLRRFPQDPGSLEGRYLLCMSLRRLGRTQDALGETLSLLRAAQAFSAEDQARWAYWQRRTGNQLANDFYEGGDFPAALAVYQALADLREDPAWRWPALYQIGLCYERLRQTERAAAAYKAIIEEADAVAKAGAANSDANADIRRMAEWRLTQIDWSGAVDRDLRALTTPPHDQG